MVPKFDLVVCENVKLKIFFKNSSKNETKPILYCLFCLRSKLRRFDFPQLVEAEWALAFSICRTATVPSLSLRGRPLSFLCKSGIGQRRGEKANACYYRRRRKVLDTKERGEAASPGCWVSQRGQRFRILEKYKKNVTKLAEYLTPFSIELSIFLWKIKLEIELRSSILSEKELTIDWTHYPHG